MAALSGMGIWLGLGYKLVSPAFGLMFLKEWISQLEGDVNNLQFILALARRAPAATMGPLRSGLAQLGSQGSSN